MTKSIWRSRTVWLAVLQATIGILVAVDAQNSALGLAGVIAILKSTVDIWLRLQTFTEIEAK